MTINLSQIASVTFKKARQEIIDNFFLGHAAWYMIKKSNSYETADGGEQIQEPILYDENPTAMFYDGADQLSVVESAGIDAALFDWKQAAATVVITGEQQRKNRGKSQIVNLLNIKKDQASQTMTKMMDQAFLKAGSTSTSKEIHSLDTVVSTSAGSFGGISASSYSWWDNQRLTWVPTSDTLEDKLDELWLECTVGREKPNLILTGKDQFLKYKIQGRTYRQIQSSELAELGFENVTFNGTPIVWDEYVLTDLSTSRWYMLNTNHLKLRYHPEANFSIGKFQEVPAQDLIVSKILWMGNLTCNQRRTQGVLTAASS